MIMHAAEVWSGHFTAAIIAIAILTKLFVPKVRIKNVIVLALVLWLSLMFWIWFIFATWFLLHG